MDQKIVMMGEVELGFEGTELISLGLGSCIGIVIYEPGKKIAAMGHIMLSDSTQNRLLPHEKQNVLLGLPDQTYLNLITNIVLKSGHNLLKNEITKDGIISSYLALKPNLLIFDSSLSNNETELAEDLFLKDQYVRMMMLCRLYRQEILTALAAKGVKEIIFPPLTEERLSILINSSLNTHLLKFADVMVPYMIEKLEMIGLNRSKLVAKMAGGAKMFAGMESDMLNIGEKNAEKVKTMLNRYNIKLLAEDLGGFNGRTVKFEVSSQNFVVKTKEGYYGI